MYVGIFEPNLDILIHLVHRLVIFKLFDNDILHMCISAKLLDAS